MEQLQQNYFFNYFRILTSVKYAYYALVRRQKISTQKELKKKGSIFSKRQNYPAFRFRKSFKQIMAVKRKLMLNGSGN